MVTMMELTTIQSSKVVKKTHPKNLKIRIAVFVQTKNRQLQQSSSSSSSLQGYNHKAAPHYIDMIEHMTFGHKFNVTTRIVWQIDPFGHSAVYAYLLGIKVLIRDPVDDDEEGTRVQTDALIKGTLLEHRSVEIKAQLRQRQYSSCSFYSVCFILHRCHKIALHLIHKMVKPVFLSQDNLGWRLHRHNSCAFSFSTDVSSVD